MKNALRMAVYHEFYPERMATPGRRGHDDHCIDMLREVIMCDSDVTPVTFYDALSNPTRKLPMPDFSTLHTCRNFDAVLEWNANNDRTIQWDEIGLDLSDVEHP